MAEIMLMLEKGAFQVITGDGKGKTTAALGMALAAVAHGAKVFMVQFLKAPNTSGEHFAAQAFSEQLTIRPMGRKGFIRGRGAAQADKSMAEAALQEARSALVSGNYRMVILDEANVAASLGLVGVEALMELLKAKPADVTLIITGRYAPPELLERADSVLEMRKVKHPFDSGVPATEGIEF
jgi:cob(I)alamin adenosyltransferase